MDLQKHLFWIGIGVVFVVEIALYFVLVAPKDAAIADSETQLDTSITKLSALSRLSADDGDELRSLMTDEWVEHYQKKTGLYAKELTEALDFFKAKDERLESFFDGRNQFSDDAEFRAKYRDQFNLMQSQVERVASVESKQGKGFQLDAIRGVEDINAVQKRFWIQRAIADAVIATGEAISGSPEPEGGGEPLPPPPRRMHVVSVTVQEPKDSPLPQFKSIPFKAQIQMPFSRMSGFVAFILRHDLMFQVQSVRVEKLRDQMLPNDKALEQRRFPSQEASDALPDDQILPERPVLVTLEGDVLDYQAQSD